MVVTKDAITPTAMDIKRGETVTFKSGGSGTFGIEVGELDSVTVSGGLIETYAFPEAGTYEVKEIISSNTATIYVS